MKPFSTRIMSGACRNEFSVTVQKVSSLLEQHPSLLEPFRGADGERESFLSAQDMVLYPTVLRTVLLYDRQTDAFCKILHPLTPMRTFRFLFVNRARSVWKLSELLLSRGVKVAEVTAYGTIMHGRRPFFISRRLPGQSCYDLFIRQGRRGDLMTCLKVLDEVIKLHRLGYWLGDAHLSHVFMDGTEVMGFIDLDGIRRNSLYRQKNLAKDLAGLNHPDLSLEEHDKESLLRYYAEKMQLRDEQKFRRMIKCYAEKRWKA